MANKRNHEWPQASAWDGYFTQDKAGGVTQRVDPSLVFDRLREEGFLDNSGVTTTVSEITENITVTLVAGQNRYLNCTNAPAILVEIADENAYHLQINGSCTLALTGVSWGGDEITAITTKAEISILNGIAIGVLYD